MPDEISLILNDRESGSVALLNRLITALEQELHADDLSSWAFSHLLINIREKLHHFAAIENFLASLIACTGQKINFPGEAIRFIRDYRLHWQDSAAQIAENFLQHCDPEDLTILTHSHSQTSISLLSDLHFRQIPFRVIQTLSIPGEEGRKAQERLLQLDIEVELLDERKLQETLARTDLILMGCDALMPTEFLNKAGTRKILEKAKKLKIPSMLVTESRKEITRSEWKDELTELALFEWVSLDLVDRIVTERTN